jgi:hypothetical protein
MSTAGPTEGHPVETVTEPDGATTATTGTPFAVDLSGDRRARAGWVLLIGGPVVWFAHFVVVYLVAEAGCTGDGDGLDAFDPPVPLVTTLIATALAVLVCLQLAARGHRRWRDLNRRTAGDSPGGSTGGGDRGSARSVPDAGDRVSPDGVPGGSTGGGDRGDILFTGCLLSLLSAVAILLVGAPAPFLAPC